MEKTSKKLELLAPAGSYETFRAVISAGADAVYLGGNAFGARAYANNFSEEELLQAIDYAHIHGREVYLTINTLFKEHELEGQLYDYLLPYYKQGLDAVIVQDIGAFSFIKKEFPGLDIHTSTQMTVTNRYGAQLMKDMGASRVVTAREMSFAEIKDIADHVDVEIESFIHGALCYCFSGQCLFSSMLGGRSGNRGRCAQPCRLPYEVFDSNKKRITSPDKPFILSPKDLCTIEYLPQLAESGIYSFKIEGRMKQAEYAAGVVSVYRKYMDLYLEQGADGYQVSKEDMQKLYDFGNRSGFTKGYYSQHNGKNMITFEKPNHAKGNEALQKEIRENYIQSEIKEKIKGKLILNKDFPARIEISFKDSSVVVEGDVVQASLKQPLSREKIEENIRKTGNTPFEFETLEIQAEPDIFLPMKALNQLRRDVLEQLSEQLVESYRRQMPVENIADKSTVVSTTAANTTAVNTTAANTTVANTTATNTIAANTTPADQLKNQENVHTQPALNVSIESRTQLPCLLNVSEISAIYLDSSCYTRAGIGIDLKEDVATVHATGKKAYLILPSVFRKHTSDFYREKKAILETAGLDGVVVKSYDALAFVLTEWSSMSYVIDQGLYSYNDRAVKTLTNDCPERLTAPFELNRKELLERENTNSELYLYGNLPLMTSAQCINANARSCDKTPKVLYLKDRYGKYFPVRNHCMECYNTIYNTTPLMLFGFAKELKAAGFCSFRLAFTTEKEAQIKEILHLYREVFLNERYALKDLYSGEYTNGHYKRGVE